MPYEVIDGSILEATFRGTVNAQRCLTILHYRLKTTSPLPDGAGALNTIAHQLQQVGGLQDIMLQAIASNAVLGALRLQWVYPNRYIFDEFNENVGPGKWTSGPCNAPNLAAAIEKRTNKSGRAFRGTTHLWGVPQDSLAGGLFGANYTIKLDALADKIPEVIVTTSAGTLTPIIYNRHAPVGSLPIESALAQGEVRTMRRRTVGLGI